MVSPAALMMSSPTAFDPVNAISETVDRGRGRSDGLSHAGKELQCLGRQSRLKEDVREHRDAVSARQAQSHDIAGHQSGRGHARTDREEVPGLILR